MLTIKRWVRRTLRRCKIALPYSEVICPEHVKSIQIDTDGRARVVVRQKLVFLEVPEPGDLHDTCSVTPETTFENFIFQSPDANEVGRRRPGRGVIVVDWEPRSRITPYVLHEHQHTWFPAGSHAQPALCTEFHCEIRTGMFLFEVLTPHAFEAAVVFERPQWPLLNTERRVVKYALRQLEAGAERPSILNDGQRVEWKILGPKMGGRYICVVFHQNGVLIWKDQLKKSSIVSGLRRLVGLNAS